MSNDSIPSRTQLSVNVNKIAVLRNSRGGQLPDPVEFARLCLAHGADGITVHPRPDARHIRADDVYRLADLCRTANVEFNVEGNPFAPPRPGYPGLLELCRTTRPAQVTFVPDGDGPITSDHGFEFAADADALQDVIPSFSEIGCRVSCFANADPGMRWDLARQVGADRIELYTGPYAEAFDSGSAEHLDQSVAMFADAARGAAEQGLAVNAGHDLSQDNLELFLRNVPHVAEVSIGHALISECLIEGLAATLAAYRAAIDRATARI